MVGSSLWKTNSEASTKIKKSTEQGGLEVENKGESRKQLRGEGQAVVLVTLKL